jgi:hypothetical protein
MRNDMIFGPVKFNIIFGPVKIEKLTNLFFQPCYANKWVAVFGTIILSISKQN